MLEAITPYAPLISAGSAFISAVSVLISTYFIIWTTCFRKTRRDRIDELKEEVEVKLDTYWMKRIIQGNSPDEFFNSLCSKFQKPKYKVLHRTAFNALGYENKNWAFLHLSDIEEVADLYNSADPAAGDLKETVK